MSAGLFGFIFTTLRKRANDPNNSSFWLPGRVAEARKSGSEDKLLPLKADSWDLGTISGQAGSDFQNIIKSQWWIGKVGFDRRKDPNLSKHQAIACPDNPFPKLSMSQITIEKLNNLWIMENHSIEKTDFGYHSVLTARFSYYNGENSAQNLGPLQIGGQYILEQCVCTGPSVKSGEPITGRCDDWYPSETIRGKGDFSITFKELYVDVILDIRVEGSGADRSLSAIIQKLEVRGPDLGGLPNLSVDILTVETEWTYLSEGYWIPQAKLAISSEDGVRGIILNLNATLNRIENLQKLSQMLAGQLNGLLDGIFGTVPQGKLPNQAKTTSSNPSDGYVFDRIRFSLNDPNSDYYLPLLILKVPDPCLEPCEMKDLSLSDLSFSGIEFTNIILSEVTILGFSNAIVAPEDVSFRSGGIDLVISLSSLNPGPQISVTTNGVMSSRQIPKPPLKISSSFSMRAVDLDEPILGNLSSKIASSKVQVSMDLEGEDLESLTIRVTAIVFKAKYEDIIIQSKLDSSFQDIIDEVMNQDNVKNQALRSGNERASENLAKISQFATDSVKRLIGSKLDG